MRPTLAEQRAEQDAANAKLIAQLELQLCYWQRQQTFKDSAERLEFYREQALRVSGKISRLRIKHF